MFTRVCSCTSPLHCRLKSLLTTSSKGSLMTPSASRRCAIKSCKACWGWGKGAQEGQYSTAWRDRWRRQLWRCNRLVMFHLVAGKENGLSSPGDSSCCRQVRQPHVGMKLPAGGWGTSSWPPAAAGWRCSAAAPASPPPGPASSGWRRRRSPPAARSAWRGGSSCPARPAGREETREEETLMTILWCLVKSLQVCRGPSPVF